MVCIVNCQVYNEIMKKSIQLNLGSGIHLIKNFINIDIAFDLKDLEEGIRTKSGTYANAIIDKGAKFVRASISSLPFKDNYADYIEALDSIEHVSFRQIGTAFNEIYRVLKPGGKLAMITTDFNELARLWVRDVADKPFNFKVYLNLMEVIYGHQIGGDGETHRTPFTVDFMKELLLVSGFQKKNIKIFVYPTGTKATPIFKTQTRPWSEDAVMRTTMIHVEAIK